MLNSLDLLIYVAIGFVVVAILALVLQFISKNPLVQKIGLVGSGALATVLSFCNLESTPLSYSADVAAGFAFALLAIGATVLYFKKAVSKTALIARFLSVIAVAGGLFVTFAI